MEEPPYNENDGYVGFWVQDRPYIVTGISYFNSGREYLSANDVTTVMKNKQLKDCSQPVPKYFVVAKQHEKVKYTRESPKTTDLYMNGRRYYDTKVKGKKANNKDIVSIPNIKLIDKSCDELSRFNNISIYLHSLVCSQLSNVNRSTSWVNILDTLTKERNKQCPSICTEIGCKIAKSLIKIAALRIFADPEQSITEIPVNSIDSYVPESRVGKFGMGFFSFLYWLIDHPLRSLHIYSWSKNKEDVVCGYHAIVKDSVGGLTLSVKILETCVTQTGTLMYLDCKRDKFEYSAVRKFSDQMERLKNISSVNLFRAALTDKNETTSDSHVFMSRYTTFLLNNSKKAKDSVYVGIGATRIFIEDYAQGIPINVLLGSLFVPSISTKTIKSSTLSNTKKGIATVSYNNNAQSIFTILVSEVSVVKLDPNSGYLGESIINLPSWTRLPVSRDDIILENSETAKMFENALVELLDLGAKQRSVITIQKGLKVYHDYTVNFVNKQAVTNALSIFTNKYKSFLLTNPLFTSLVSVDAKCILSDVMYIPDVESRLIKDFSNNLMDKVWYGKRVMILNNTHPSVNTGGMSSLVFVDKGLTSQTNWPITGSQSNPSMNLNPIGTDYGVSKNKSYEKLVPAEIKKRGKIHEELYMAVLAVFDGLSVKFKFLDTNRVGNFSLLYAKIFKTYGLAAWVDVSYTLLNVLSSYKGNQTYGGDQYSMALGYTSDFRLKPTNNLKLIDYEVESIMETIKSVAETQNTFFRIVNVLFPFYMEVEFSRVIGVEDKIKVQLQNFLVEKSDTLVDYTISLMLFLKTLPNVSNLKGYENHLPKIASVMLEKVKSRKYNLEDLKNMYTFAANKAVNVYTMPLLVSMDIQKLLDQTKFLIELSVKHQGIFPYSFQEPKEKYVAKFRISQLIGYLFSNEQKDKTIDQQGLTDILIGASKYESKTKLQMTEIAINEGTTKDFIPACLTELVQNSVDAIRESKDSNVKRDVNVIFGQTEGDTYGFAVGDFVGMPPSAFLHISVPFLSTKTPSEIVTGEMGSGFFNVYRESSLVIINTNYDGTNYVSYDTPIVENGRVVDVLKTVYIRDSVNNGTNIIVRSNKVTEASLSENIGTLQYTTENIISQVSLFNDIGLSINGAKPALKSSNKTHMFSIGYFDVYFIEGTKYPSYVFTKGIPFAPLVNFYGKYDKSVIMDIESSIIVNIRHGGYTPVQTRTRLNLPDTIEDQFKKLLSYIVFVKDMSLMYDDSEKGLKPGHKKWMYPNLDSTAMANQMSRQLWVALINDASVNFLNYINFDLLEKGFSADNTLTYYTNKLIVILGDENPRDDHVMVRIKKEVSKFNLSPYPEVRKLGEYLLLKWISNKNASIPRSPAPKAGGKIGKKVIVDVDPDEPDKLMEPYVKIWIETYRDKAISAGIYGWNKSDVFNIEVGKSEENENALGYFDSSKKLIYINTILWSDKDRKEIVSQVKNIKSTFDFQNLPNEKWANYFSFRYPASTIPHELEHARRKDSHEAGGHDITRKSLWNGDNATERTFDQSCNDVFSKVISEGFYDELLKRYKTAKLI
jgi:hypothetical protein